MFLSPSLSKASWNMISAELPWSMNTIFTSAFTIIAEINVGSSCPAITPSRSELEKTIFGVGGNVGIGFFILPKDTLRTSWRCFFRADFVIPPPVKPPAMTLIVLITGFSSSQSWLRSYSEVLWLLGFLLSSSPWSNARLLCGLLWEATYLANLPSLINCSTASWRL